MTLHVIVLLPLSACGQARVSTARSQRASATAVRSCVLCAVSPVIDCLLQVISKLEWMPFGTRMKRAMQNSSMA